MKIIPCPACGRRVKPQKYCPVCGCYLPPLLEEEGISYDTDYMWHNLNQLGSCLNTYSEGYNTYFMGKKISSPDILDTTNLNDTVFTIYSQTQATQEQINQSMKQQMAQLNSELRRYKQLNSELHQYEINFNNNTQTQFILSQLSNMNFKPYQNKTKQGENK